MYKLLDYGQKIEHLQNVAVDGSITSKSVPMRGGGKPVPITGVRRFERGPRAQIQGGSNMTGTDLYVNKPHCVAAVRL